jgi:hypothetical protein
VLQIINHVASKEGAQCPIIVQLNEHFAQTNPFRHRKKGRKPTRKQDKNKEVKKIDVLWKDASTEPNSQSPRYGITYEKIGHTWRQRPAIEELR